jgi:hypothetical protein
VLPDGTSGALCPAAPGTLCGFCNPQVSTDCAEAGAKCVVTNSHETFCGRLCETTACPNDYTCMTVKLAGGQTTKQCIPTDLSCYY